jgi:23S rRNA-/tRNA-specific pseudouridylate synthase
LESEKLSLAEEIRKVYKDDETDGILKLAASMKTTDFDVDELIAGTLEAVQEKKGEVASIMNALIGSCCLMEDRETASDRVQELLEAYEELEETKNITPDIVTFSLAYKALSLDADSIDFADFVLDTAVRKSKKMAGGKRRKTVASSRRKSSSTCSASEDELKTLIGEDFSVLHETDDFVVINKPSGVPCFHKKKTTAGKIKKGKGKQKYMASDVSLEDALLNCNIPLSTLNPEAMGLVHRLDRGSSGCMVLAKTDEMHANLVAEFFLRRTQKRYLALVAPAPDSSVSDEGYIDLPVDGRPAKSKYRVVERYGTGAAALLEFDIYTGRKHQVRIHAAEGLSSPVLMDNLYSSGRQDSTELENLVKFNEGKQHFFLHSSSLVIPENGIDVKAPLPSWWDDTIASLK